MSVYLLGYLLYGGGNVIFRLSRYNGASNVINKNIVLVHEVDVTFKKSTDMLRPVIILELGSSFNPYDHNINYAITYGGFNRYYFVDTIEQLTSGFYKFYLRVDVLETYRQQILTSDVLSVKTGVEVQIDIVKSNKKLDGNTSYILTTLGVE